MRCEDLSLCDQAQLPGTAKYCKARTYANRQVDQVPQPHLPLMYIAHAYWTPYCTQSKWMHTDSQPILGHASAASDQTRASPPLPSFCLLHLASVRLFCHTVLLKQMANQTFSNGSGRWGKPTSKVLKARPHSKHVNAESEAAISPVCHLIHAVMMLGLLIGRSPGRRR